MENGLKYRLVSQAVYKQNANTENQSKKSLKNQAVLQKAVGSNPTLSAIKQFEIIAKTRLLQLSQIHNLNLLFLKVFSRVFFNKHFTNREIKSPNSVCPVLGFFAS